MQEPLNIPKGISDGQNLRMSGRGNVGDANGKAGDLIVKISVKPDPYFKRDGYDVVTNAYLSIS